ncbi:hypothetical protein CDL15_Pgr022090 [Punica granatum]|uniref:PHD finger protein ALFIN-LIKE n=1 Tax=Punica granatum TaxID=22663 RepID=A0A218VS65_PUNGR|nr:hypothetical protein CDL15_Pgr022090 [Punica granatum]
MNSKFSLLFFPSLSPLCVLSPESFQFKLEKEIDRETLTESCEPSKVVKLFNDLKGRRAALIKAFTTDKEGQALYRFPDGHWEVKVPEEELPPKLLEPTIAINVSKDDMLSQEWLCDVAANSDTLLLFVMSHCSASLKFSKDDRRQLFNMINDLPTVLEVVSSGTVEKPKEVKSAVLNNSSCHPGPNSGTQEIMKRRARAIRQLFIQSLRMSRLWKSIKIDMGETKTQRVKTAERGPSGTLFIQSLRISRLCKKNTKVNMGP